MRSTMEANNIILIISFLISDTLISDSKLINLNTVFDLISDYVHFMIKNIIKGDSFLDVTLLILIWGGVLCVRFAAPWESPWNR